MSKTNGFAPVNGQQMYYEIEGNGEPLVYIHPAFGHATLNPLPGLAESNSVIRIDLPGHGRTADIPDRPFDLRQIAEDIVDLLAYLGIAKTNLFGESYGGAIATLIAVHHPEVVGRVATYGATFGPPHVAVKPEVLQSDPPPTAEGRAFQYQRDSYMQVAPDPAYWPKLWAKVANVRWDGFSSEELASIPVPFLIAVGDHDFVRLEHALETFRLIPHAELAVIPDAGHFVMFSESARVIPVVNHFMHKPVLRPQIATAATGYVPGETR